MKGDNDEAIELRWKNVIPFCYWETQIDGDSVYHLILHRSHFYFSIESSKLQYMLDPLHWGYGT